ncbi:hypothetical protein [Bradyrhizobium sp. USDA 4461]
MLVAKHLPTYSFVDLKDFLEQSVPRVSVQRHFGNAGETLRAVDGAGFMVGSYLRVVVPVNESEGREEEKLARAEMQLKTFVAVLTLVYGTSIAAQRHALFLVNLVEPSCIVDSDDVWGSGYVERERLVHAAIVSAIEHVSGTGLDTSEKVLSLLSRAHHESDPTHRFLAYWLAVEVAIGDGRARRKFATVDLKSPSLDDKLNRLRDLRGRYVHEGKIISPTFLDDMFLKLAVLLKICVDPIGRANLLRVFDDITSREAEFADVDVGPYSVSVTIGQVHSSQ